MVRKRKGGEHLAKQHEFPTIALGIDDSEELNRNASKEEIARGEYTKVTTLSFDEVDTANKPL
nr:hypothetical protein [Anoxybacillus voinovskiensis]